MELIRVGFDNRHPQNVSVKVQLLWVLGVGSGGLGDLLSLLPLPLPLRLLVLSLRLRLLREKAIDGVRDNNYVVNAGILVKPGRVCGGERTCGDEVVVATVINGH